jgi:PGF-pre-PGF domain-containing protein
MIYLNGTFQSNVTNGTQYYNATGLTADTVNNISIRTVDIADNVNLTWINHTSTTALAILKEDKTKPAVTKISLYPTTPEMKQSVNIIAEVSDENLNTSAIYVSVRHPSSYTNTSPMITQGNGTYSFNYTNTSEYGRYDITIIASDLAGNINNTEKTWFVTTMLPYVNSSVNTIANNVTVIDAREKANTTLELFTSNDTTAGTIYITLSSAIPPEINQTFLLIPLGKFITINASEDLKNNLTSGWLIIKLYYTSAELNGLDEASLKMTWYNKTSQSWQNLASGSPTWVHSSGVVTADINGFAGYVWANISHLSIFGIVGSYPAASQQVSSNGGGGNGGGGGGGGSSGENFTNIELVEKYDMQISKDALTSYRFTHAKNPIMFVNITGNTSLGVITASIEVLKNSSSLVNVSPEGLVYMNANIWVGTTGFATPKNIKQALIKFRIDNAWMSTNRVTAGDIVIMKWDGTGWIKLETKLLSKDDTYSYFEGKTKSFSPFAIVAVKADEQKSTVTTPVLTGTPEVTATGAPVTTKKSPGFGIVLALTGLTAVVLRKRSW